MLALPLELICMVYRQLPDRDRIRLSGCSQLLHRICFHAGIWKELTILNEREGGLPPATVVRITSSQGARLRTLHVRSYSHRMFAALADSLMYNLTDLTAFSMDVRRPEDLLIANAIFDNNPRLVRIKLIHSPFIHQPTLERIGRCCPRLEHLDVSSCYWVDGAGIDAVVRGCRRLKSLTWEEARYMLPQEYSALRTPAPAGLQHLLMIGCSRLQANALHRLLRVDLRGTGSPRSGAPVRALAKLDLSDAIAVDDHGFATCLRQLPNLRHLSLAGCIGIGQETLTGVVPSLQQLHYLNLARIPSVSDESLAVIAESAVARRLERLVLYRCGNVGDAGVEILLLHCTRLQLLVLESTCVTDETLHHAVQALHRRGRLGPRAGAECRVRAALEAIPERALSAPPDAQPWDSLCCALCISMSVRVSMQSICAVAQGNQSAASMRGPPPPRDDDAAPSATPGAWIPLFVWTPVAQERDFFIEHTRRLVEGAPVRAAPLLKLALAAASPRRGCTDDGARASPEGVLGLLRCNALLAWARTRISHGRLAGELRRSEACGFGLAIPR